MCQGTDLTQIPRSNVYIAVYVVSTADCLCCVLSSQFASPQCVCVCVRVLSVCGLRSECYSPFCILLHLSPGLLGWGLVKGLMCCDLLQSMRFGYPMLHCRKVGRIERVVGIGIFTLFIGFYRFLGSSVSSNIVMALLEFGAYLFSRRVLGYNVHQLLPIPPSHPCLHPIWWFALAVV